MNRLKVCPTFGGAVQFKESITTTTAITIYRLTERRGRFTFVTDVSRILARNGLAYDVTESGKVRRILPAVIGDMLARAYFRTGDQLLDVMLVVSDARSGYGIRNPAARSVPC